MSNAPLSILDQLVDYDNPHLTSLAELRALCDQLELYGAYQILTRHREADRGGLIEIEITYEKPK